MLCSHQSKTVDPGNLEPLATIPAIITELLLLVVYQVPEKKGLIL
jgi:hypothetical protein